METELTAGHGPVECKKERLMHDIKGVVADADELLKEVARDTFDDLAMARTAIAGRLGEARLRFGNGRLAAGTSARHAADATQDYARRNPWKLIGLAAVGVVIGIALSRR